MHPAIEELLRDCMGFAPETVGHTVIDKIIRRCVADSAASSAEAFVDLVRSDPEEMLRLIDAVVVPETWFFRDHEAFAALSNWTIREWLPRSSPAGALRVLSLPCSTGEEPYSIAMTLLNTGFAKSRFRIDGVDISGAHVTKARIARYTQNSFRKCDMDSIRSYFAEAGGAWELCSAVRGMVSFSRSNILDAEWQFNSDTYDVIFCRNLLIYFDAKTQESVFRTLDRLLRPGGLLFVGSAEAYLVRTLGYSALDHRMSFAYRKPDPNRPEKAGYQAGSRGKKAARTRPAAAPPPRTEAMSSHSRTRKKHAAETAAKPVQPPETPNRTADADTLTRARAMADAGKLAEARKLCLQHVDESGASAECFLLLGLLDDSEGNAESASHYYRKALYIDPHHEHTLVHLAATADKRGDASAAKRFRARAQRSASPKPSLAPGDIEGQET